MTENINEFSGKIPFFICVFVIKYPFTNQNILVLDNNN